MGPIDLNLLRAFAAVYESGSFSGAAARLHVPRSTVSRSVAALEDGVGAQLFHRTTRKVAVTAEGRALYARVAPSLGALESALSEVPRRPEDPSGVLRVTATPDIARVLLAEVVARFTARFPKVGLELHLTGRVVDLLEEGFDLALRVASRPLVDSALIARKVGTIAIQLFAAPSYLARRGTPRTPEDLPHHDWVTLVGTRPLVLTGPDGRVPVDIEGRIQVDDMLFVEALVEQGAGLAALPSFLAASAVAEGTLTRVLPRWASESGSVYLVHPGGRNLPARLVAFKALLTEVLHRRPLE